MTRFFTRHRVASLIAAVGVVAAAAGCSNDLTGMNRNPNSPTDAPPGPLFTNATRSAVSRFRGSNWDLTMASLFAQQFAKVQYVDEDQYKLRTATIDAQFAGAYTGELEDFQKVIAKGLDQSQPNIYGPALVMKTWTYQIMTDTWGDIPYSEALQGDQPDGSITPAYDPQQAIYDGFFADLTKAATDMTAPSAADPGLGGADPIYAGDPLAWKKFANSMRARAALRIVNVDQAKANTELTAALSAPGGVMTSNLDNAKLVWPGDGIYDNPWSSNFQTRDDHRVSKVLADTLLALSDPRITVFAQPTTDGTTADGHPCLPSGCYDGLQNGLSTANASTYFNNTSRPGAIFYSGSTAYGTFGSPSNAKTPSYLMVYAEVAFIQAEAAERGLGGLTAGQAAGFYNEGVRASFAQWGLSDAQATAYLAQPDVAYAGGATGLKQIGLQKWIALFTQGSEAWAEYRRTGNPSTLTPGPAAILDQIPRRVFYSSQEQSINGDALAAAIARQGPDDLTTCVWWDTSC